MFKVKQIILKLGIPLREHQKQTLEMLDDHHWEIRENQQIQGLGLHNGLSG